MIAKESRVNLPIDTVPLPLLKSILRLGAGKLLDIPAESMNFLVKSEFPVKTKVDMERKSGTPTSVEPSTLPFVITDLDFRLSHSISEDQNDFSQRRRANLITPVLHPLDSVYRYSFLTQKILKHSTPSKLKKTMLKNNDFISENERLDNYIQYLFNDLKSPRVRKTTAEVMSSLTQSESIQLQPQNWKLDKVKILWGERDNKHHIPKQYESIATTYIPFGHQFPISEPEITANWMAQVLKSSQSQP